MTRVGIDPEAALIGARNLDTVRVGLESESRIPGPGLSMLPPNVTVSLEFEVRRLRAELGRDAYEAQRIRVALARTQLRFLLASGEGDPGILLELLRLSSFGHFGQILDDADGLLESSWLTGITAFLGGFVDAIDEADAFTTMPAYLGLLGWARLHGGNLPPSRFMKLLDLERGVFGSRGAVGKLWGPFSDGVMLVHGYQNSSAVTPAGKTISSLLQLADLKAWDRVAGGLPLGTTLDAVSGGVLTGGLDAIVVLSEHIVTLDTRGLERLTEDALSGKKGWGIQALAGIGDGISYARTGDIDDWQAAARKGSYGPVLEFGQKAQDKAIEAAWDGTAAVGRATSRLSPFW